MNREIKFRIWNKKLEKWHDVLTLRGQKPINPADGVNAWLTEGVSINNFLNNEDYVVTEFTGLKDKSGKDIYEGDIIKYIYNLDKKNGGWSCNEIGEVVYDGTGFKFEGKNLSGFFCSLPGLFPEQNPIDLLEVIGNVF